jgi:hypothetical protein
MLTVISAECAIMPTGLSVIKLNAISLTVMAPSFSPTRLYEILHQLSPKA